MMTPRQDRLVPLMVPAVWERVPSTGRGWCQRSFSGNRLMVAPVSQMASVLILAPAKEMLAAIQLLVALIAKAISEPSAGATTVRTFGLGQSMPQSPSLLHHRQGMVGGSLDLLPAFPGLDEFSLWLKN